jgi:hypothetical protein
MAMPKIEFRTQMFRGDWDQVWSQRRMLWMMEALCRVNQTHLQEFAAFKARGLVAKNYPSVYRSGLHYETEKGTEIWPDIPSMLEGTMGPGVYPGFWSDCEDLACYRVAELRELPWHYERPSKTAKGKTEHADPAYPQEPAAIAAAQRNQPWPGWKRVSGGIPAKPFAKWRRGLQGQYHYHALVFLPDGRLEDPSLVLGMGREAEFSAAGMAERLKNGAQVVLQYAKQPDVMVVDPEKPSGYGGGKSKEMDQKVLERLKQELSSPSGITASTPLSGDQRELRAFAGNPVGDVGDLLRSEGVADLDRALGWSREHRQFIPYSVKAELRRLTGYANH